ncbi:MAG: MMPL family transporter, partial [Gammaproteobacteria bacterium]|nr:MMPL family transporter [Gammaproteobacteria bacterium]
MLNLAARAYVRMLRYPRAILSVLLLVTGVAGFFSTQFSFDASSDTLVVEGDQDLANYQQVAKRFGGDKFLLLTFAPHEGRALDAVNVGYLDQLTTEIRAIPGVRGIFSILDAPLIKSPPIPLDELEGGFRNLRSEDVDWELAQAELTNSPLFSELLISRDGRATAIRIDLAPDDTLDEVVTERDLLQAKKALSPVESVRLSELFEDHVTLREAFLDRRDDLIAAVRDVRVSYADRGVLHLGGVPMIAADMIAYAKDDLLVFGGGVLVIVMVVLFLFFRRTRWVLLPIATSALAIVLTIGVLGFVQRPATVISSNFVSLLAITTISL